MWLWPVASQLDCERIRRSDAATIFALNHVATGDPRPRQTLPNPVQGAAAMNRQCRAPQNRTQDCSECCSPRYPPLCVVLCAVLGLALPLLKIDPRCPASIPQTAAPFGPLAAQFSNTSIRVITILDD